MLGFIYLNKWRLLFYYSYKVLTFNPELCSCPQYYNLPWYCTYEQDPNNACCQRAKCDESKTTPKPQPSTTIIPVTVTYQTVPPEVTRPQGITLSSSKYHFMCRRNIIGLICKLSDWKNFLPPCNLCNKS